MCWSGTLGRWTSGKHSVSAFCKTTRTRTRAYVYCTRGIVSKLQPAVFPFSRVTTFQSRLQYWNQYGDRAWCIAGVYNWLSPWVIHEWIWNQGGPTDLVFLDLWIRVRFLKLDLVDLRKDVSVSEYIVVWGGPSTTPVHTTTLTFHEFLSFYRITHEVPCLQAFLFPGRHKTQTALSTLPLYGSGASSR